MAKIMKKSAAKIRLWVQIIFTALSNGYLVGFAKGRIFTGPSKAFCLPGLSCYSCPGALGSCPIGSLQAVLGSRGFGFSFYIIGFFLLIGSLLGRFVCGWLCPFGLFQDLLYKIPFVKKLKNLPGHKALVLIKYLMLTVMVIILPMLLSDITGLGKPWFCQYVCPSGTLMAGLPLLLTNETVHSAIGFLFTWKLAILIGIILLSIAVYRPFCKYICPLGAIYGFFNRIALYRYKVDQDLCIRCGHCQKTCKMDIPVWKQPNSTECIRCGQCISACPKSAISHTFSSCGNKTKAPKAKNQAPN